MKKFIFDLQRFTVAYEYVGGTKTFTNTLDNKILVGGKFLCTVSIYFNNEPLKSGNDIFYQDSHNYTVNHIGEKRRAYFNNEDDWVRIDRYTAEWVANIELPGDNRILRVRTKNPGSLTNHGGANVQMYGNIYDDALINYGTNAKIKGNAGNDLIANWGNGNVIIEGDADDDKIENTGSGVTIYGGIGDDYIDNYGDDNVVIDGGKDDDTIRNTGNNVTINGGDDDDEINNYAIANVKVNGDSGDDTINNTCSDVTINGGIDDDKIWNKGLHVEINGGTDDDDIWNDGENVIINGDADDDTISNTANNVTIDGGEDDGDDNIFNGGDNWNGGDNVSIQGGDGNDHIYNYGNNVTIDGGAANDHIGNSASFVTVKLGNGNDSVYNTGDNVSIDALDSSDGDKNLIYNDSSFVTITAGAGSESIINNQGKNVTIDASDGTNEVSIFGGENISVTTGGGENSIIAYGNYTGGLDQAPLVTYGNYSGKYLTIDAGDGKNLVSIGSDWSYVIVEGGDAPKGVDVIFNDGKNALLKGNAGNDYIRNTSDNAVILGGEDGDIIENYGNHAYIQGDDSIGNSARNVGDYIYTDKGDDVTVDGGANDDTITAWHDVRGSINGGAGNDYISVNRIQPEELDKISNQGLSHITWTAIDLFTPFPNLENFVTALQSSSSIGEFINKFYVKGELKKWFIGGVFGVLKNISNVLSIYNAIKDFANFVSYISDLSPISTIDGGAGDDTIVSDGFAPRIFEYYNGHGNDIIHRFAVDSTLKSALNLLSNDNFTSTLNIKSGRIGHIAVIGNDVTFVVGTGSATGSVKLVDGANKKFKLVEDEEGGSVFTRAYGINYDTNEVVCSIFGSAADEDIQDNVGIKRDRTTYIGVNVEAKDTIIGETFANVIYGNGGNDNLRGNDKNDTIYGGNGDDIIDGNGGNDVLYGYDGTDEIYGGAGNDTIYSNEGDTVDGGTGDDYIRNSGDNASISAGDDNDTVENYGDKATIETGAGNDKIIHSGSNTKINAGDNNDTIKVHQNNTTVEAGNGNDSIQVGNITGSDSNVTFNIKVNAGANNDTVESYVSNVTIAGEVGDDLIILSAGADRNFIDYKDGDGHDEIRGLTDDDTLKISSGKVSKATVEGSDVILTIGEGSLRFKNFSNKEFKFTAADGEIFKCKLFADSVTKEMAGSIVGGKGQTTLYGTSYSDRFYGSDEIDVIYGNDGNDNLYGEGGNDSIYGGEGNDYIDGGKGTNTLIGGKGNDSIYAAGINNLIIYNYGDGNDRVFGSGTLRILGASYSSLESQGNMILKVGDNEIILVNNSNGRYFKVEGDFAGELAPEGTYLDGDTLRFKENYSDNTFDANNISLPIKGIDASLLNKGITVFSNGSIDLFTGSKFSDVYYCDMNSADSPAKTFLMAEDSAEVSPATIKAGGGNDTIFGGERENLYVYSAGDGDDVIYNVGGADALSVLGGTYARSINDNDLIVKVGSGSVTFKNAATQTLNILGEEESKPAEPTWTLNGTTATYGDSITVTGIKSLEGVSLNNKTVTISNSALNQSTVTISDGYTLELADDVVKVSTTAAGWTKSGSTYIYTAVGTSAGYKLSGNKISYTPASGGDKFTITGLKNTSAVTVEGKTVTLSADALNEENVTITKGYTLKIADDVPTSSTKTKAGWNGDTYTAAGTPAYYKLASNKLTFTPAKGGETFTLTGIKSTNGVKVSGKKVTVGKTALGDSDVTFSTEDGFTLVFDKTVPAAKEIKSGWKKFTYTAEGSTAGYKLDGDKIVYSEQDGGETFTISGVKDIKNIFVDGKTVTVGKNSLNGKTVELTGDTFELALAGDVPTEATEKSGKFTSCAKGTAIFKTSSYSNDFYTLGDDGKITYTAAGGNEIKISGLNPNATLADVPSAIKISDDGGSLKISFNSADVLNGKAPTISAPKGVTYTVAVDEALSTAEESLKWKSKSTAATLSADTGATYTVKGNKVVYTKGKTSTAAVLTGLANTELVTPDEKVIALDADNLGTKTSLKSNAGGYSIELTGDMSGKTFVGSTGADTIDIAATGALVDGGKGNDQFNISGSDVTIISSAGSDVANFADGLTVSLSGTTTVKELEQTDSGVQLTFSNKATLNVTDVTDTFDVVGKKQNFTVDTDKFALADSLTFGKSSVTVAADFTGALTPNDDIYLTGGKLSTVTTIDASAVTEGISIEGNAKANKIISSGGDDTLWGGVGNDTLIGGDGSDTFIYNNGEGKDVISGFTNDDLLEIVGNFTTSVNKTGTEIAFKVGNTANAITLKEFTTEEFNINGEVYQISGNELVKK